MPDPACEYILSEQDVVIMTATTLINKTMPRLLALSRNARDRGRGTEHTAPSAHVWAWY